MSPSPESTGGAGFTFEDSVVAFYFVALLVEGGARGLPEAVIDTVGLQQASIGNPLDDVIVDATIYEDPHRYSSRKHQCSEMQRKQENQVLIQI